MEANIRTFPPSPPTHDIAVRFAWLLCPDWVYEEMYIGVIEQDCHASHPLLLFSPPSPLRLHLRLPPPPPPPLPLRLLSSPPPSSPLSSTCYPLLRLPEPRVPSQNTCSLGLRRKRLGDKIQLESLLLAVHDVYCCQRDNHSEPCSQVSVWVGWCGGDSFNRVYWSCCLCSPCATPSHMVCGTCDSWT